MPSFSYIAKDSAGRVQNGLLDAPSIREVVSQLRTQGWFVVQIQEQSGEEAEQTRKKELPKRTLEGSLSRLIHVEISLKQLALLLKGGMSLLEALETVSAQTQNAKFSRVWSQVAERIRKGQSLAEAMERYRCFNLLVIQLVEVGEQTGKLEQVLRRASYLLEKRRLLRSRLLHALAYPCLVLCITLGVTAFMVMSVIPKIENFLRMLNKKLHPFSQLMVDFANWCTIYGVYLGLLTLSALGLFFVFYTLPTGRYLIDRFSLRIPLLGKVIRLSGTILFARTLSTLIGSGLTVTDSLRSIARLHYNKYLAQQISRSLDSVVLGSSLAKPLSRSQAYMPLLANMIAIGESSGNLEECLEEVALFYEEQLDLLLQWVGTIGAPLIIIVIGTIIGFVYVAFFIAVFGSVTFKGA